MEGGLPISTHLLKAFGEGLLDLWLAAHGVLMNGLPVVDGDAVPGRHCVCTALTKRCWAGLAAPSKAYRYDCRPSAATFSAAPRRSPGDADAPSPTLRLRLLSRVACSARASGRIDSTSACVCDGVETPRLHLYFRDVGWILWILSNATTCGFVMDLKTSLLVLGIPHGPPQSTSLTTTVGLQTPRSEQRSWRVFL